MAFLKCDGHGVKKTQIRPSFAFGDELEGVFNAHSLSEILDRLSAGSKIDFSGKVNSRAIPAGAVFIVHAQSPLSLGFSLF
ncbi:MAG: hypothetical protein ACFFDN_01785 [Candidatus Hodarchaeota archaeon]